MAAEIARHKPKQIDIDNVSLQESVHAVTETWKHNKESRNVMINAGMTTALLAAGIGIFAAPLSVPIVLASAGGGLILAETVHYWRAFVRNTFSLAKAFFTHKDSYTHENSMPWSLHEALLSGKAVPETSKMNIKNLTFSKFVGIERP